MSPHTAGGSTKLCCHLAEGFGHLEEVNPDQLPFVLPQTFPAGAPGHGKDQALLLQPCTDQLGELTPP